MPSKIKKRRHVVSRPLSTIEANKEINWETSHYSLKVNAPIVECSFDGKLSKDTTTARSVAIRQRAMLTVHQPRTKKSSLKILCGKFLWEQKIPKERTKEEFSLSQIGIFAEVSLNAETLAHWAENILEHLNGKMENKFLTNFSYILPFVVKLIDGEPEDNLRVIEMAYQIVQELGAISFVNSQRLVQNNIRNGSIDPKFKNRVVYIVEGRKYDYTAAVDELVHQLFLYFGLPERKKAIEPKVLWDKKMLKYFFSILTSRFYRAYNRNIKLNISNVLKYNLSAAIPWLDTSFFGPVEKQGMGTNSVLLLLAGYLGAALTQKLISISEMILQEVSKYLAKYYLGSRIWSMYEGQIQDFMNQLRQEHERMMEVETGSDDEWTEQHDNGLFQSLFQTPEPQGMDNKGFFFSLIRKVEQLLDLTDDGGTLDYFNKVEARIHKKTRAIKRIYYLLWAVVDWVWIRVFGEHHPWGPFATELREAARWMKAVEELKINGFAYKVKTDKTLQKLGEKTLKDGYEIARRILEGCVKSYYSVFMENLTWLNNLMEHVIRSKYISPDRDEPVVVLLVGPAGSGKSSTIDLITSALCQHMGVEYTRSQRYERKTENVYWSGYNEQIVTSVDDIFQLDDYASKGREALELIQMANCCPYPLHMADISEKNTVFFKSPFVILTTNLTNFRNIGVSSVQAFARRISMIFHVSGGAEILEKTFSECFIDKDYNIVRTANELNFTQMEEAIWEESQKKKEYSPHKAAMAYKIRVERQWNPFKTIGSYFADGVNEKIPDLFKSFRDCSTEWYYDIVNHIKSNTSYLKIGACLLAAGAAFITSVKAITSMVRWMRGPKKRRDRKKLSRFYSERAYSSENRGSRVRRQVSTNKNSLDFASNLWKKNIVEISVQRLGKHRHMRMLMIGGLFGITAAHFTEFLKEGDYITVDRQGALYHVPYEEVLFKKLDKEDLVLVQFRNPHFPKFRDIRHQFLLEEDLKRGVLFDSHLIVGTSGGCIDKYVRNMRHLEKPILGDDEVYRPGHYLFGEVHTLNGECGSPYVTYDRKTPRCIFAIHVAGTSFLNRPCGIGAILTQERLDSLIQSMPIVELPEQETVKPQFLVPQGCEELGTMPPHMSVQLSSVTAIRESMIHGILYKPCTLPAVLSVQDGVSPMQLALRKMGGPSYIIEEEIVDRIFSRIFVPAVTKKILTIEEAIGGIDSDPYIGPLKTGTSSGYPYILKRTKKGKKDHIWWDEELGKYSISEYMREKCIQRLEAYKQDVRVRTIWVDNLKDERRPIEKVLACKTRIFVTPPVDFSIVARQLQQTFVSSIMHYHLRGECLVGINPHSRSWGMLFHRLKEKFPNPLWIAGDFSSFDGTIPSSFGWGVCRFINRWYSDGYVVAREALYDDIINAVHLAGNTLYRVNKGNPSGMPLTTIYNSLVNMALMRFCWMVLVEALELPLVLEDFEKNVSMAVYGDDNLLAVNPHMYWFNMRSIGKVLSTIGMTYGDASKKGIERDFVPEEEITFLKRKFVTRRGVVYAPLEESSIHELTNWVHDTLPPDFALAQNCNDYVREYFHYGREVMEAKQREINQVLISNGLDHILVDLSYDELMDTFINHDV